ncbi:hypothetical protein HYPSUDRAFT_46798 [Hypholoma sublateritium FD-334 SS-4]|uniref:Secreted protein n=1 Tax=Hypholoma sublateritium (strain FD-334 SS-4) TaxID=945553 RepID=A0A0D2KQU3_HYPSF|nr:hypothetical protein HYPSUDRAFT_46798 [Hypholoma sublateritium FD-334 SS-4]
MSGITGRAGVCFWGAHLPLWYACCSLRLILLRACSSGTFFTCDIYFNWEVCDDDAVDREYGARPSTR